MALVPRVPVERQSIYRAACTKRAVHTYIAYTLLRPNSSGPQQIPLSEVHPRAGAPGPSFTEAEGRGTPPTKRIIPLDWG